VLLSPQQNSAPSPRGGGAECVDDAASPGAGPTIEPLGEFLWTTREVGSENLQLSAANHAVPCGLIGEHRVAVRHRDCESQRFKLAMAYRMPTAN
jgi:hypothetical protein